MQVSWNVQIADDGPDDAEYISLWGGAVGKHATVPVDRGIRVVLLVIRVANTETHGAQCPAEVPVCLAKHPRRSARPRLPVGLSERRLAPMMRSQRGVATVPTYWSSAEPGQVECTTRGVNGAPHGSEHAHAGRDFREPGRNAQSALRPLRGARGVVLEPVQGVVFEVGGGLGERAPRVWRARVAVVVLRVPPVAPSGRLGRGERGEARRGRRALGAPRAGGSHGALTRPRARAEIALRALITFVVVVVVVVILLTRLVAVVEEPSRRCFRRCLQRVQRRLGEAGGQTVMRARRERLTDAPNASAHDARHAILRV